MAEVKRKIAVVTTCTDDWGGSEELWAKTLPFLQKAGFEITVYKNKINRSHPKFCALLKQGIALCELDIPVYSFLERMKQKVTSKIKPEIKVPHNLESHLIYLLHIKKPELVIVSQGINFDGTGIGYICSYVQIPYVLIAQKAVDFFWPSAIDRKAMCGVYQQAAKAYFVSDRNRKLTEEQLGVRFTNAEIVFNPIKISRKVIPMPDTAKSYRLACIGRFFLIDKGQDILIRIMAMRKWQERPVAVSFIGSGNDKEALTEMAALLGAKNVEFIEQVNDIEKLWQNYHALVLPSRSEGAPLVLLEAMACGRTAIVSTAGGNPEFITDGINGFIGHANEESFDDAMERAWNARTQWEIIGNNALAYIKENIPDCPEETFANSLKSVLNG